VLYPTRDETVAAISRYRTELAEWYRVPTPAWSSVQWAWDKRNTYHLAASLGIPVPRSWQPLKEQDLASIDGQPPFAIKPAIKEHFIYATRAKAWRADSYDELVRRYRQAAALVEPGEVLIQELIPGDGRHQVAYCAFFKHGQPVGSMVARRRRQHPPEFGRASTYVETIELPEIERTSTRFLEAINYYGLVELEYKLDPRDGLFKLLDVNARTWGYHTLGERAGVDFAFLLYSDQLGLELADCRARPGVSWLRFTTDLPTALLEMARGGLSLTEYLRTIWRCRQESVASVADPAPALAELALIPYLAVRRGF
jgi:predicted ATP-grasp superfamily ATP-dependent carboligase